MTKYLIGSCLLGLQSNHDCDYLKVVDTDDSTLYKRELINNEDVLTRSTANIVRYLNFELPLEKKTVRRYIVNYQLDKNIIGQDFSIEYHILDRRSDYINLLNWIVDNEALNFRKIPQLNHGNCSKGIYHIAYTTFILENNSTTLTSEQKEIVQQIHDRRMSQDYLDVLQERIRNLK